MKLFVPAYREINLVLMEIITVTNKKTQLHKSVSDLTVKCHYENGLEKAVSSDISFFASSKAPRAFAQVHKPDYLEIWRIKTSKDGQGESTVNLECNRS